MGPKAKKYTRVVDDIDILVMDKPSLYTAKWRTKLVKVILRSANNDATYKVTSPNSNNYWTVPELFYQDTASTKKGTEAEEVPGTSLHDSRSPSTRSQDEKCIAQPLERQSLEPAVDSHQTPHVDAGTSHSPQPNTKRRKKTDAENSDDAAGTSHSPQPTTKRKRTDTENSDAAALLLTELFERKNTSAFKSKERDGKGCFEEKDNEELTTMAGNDTELTTMAGNGTELTTIAGFQQSNIGYKIQAFNSL
ncbi:uncharacterized protein [Watersipora subatra]|uniref:uncharacterized protein n=1 Tax=Watersipora subatra TaxID=2589382 RepID=UPI00355B2160